MLLLFVPIFGIQALPESWKAGLAQVLAGADLPQIVASVAVLVAVLDAGLLAAALGQFRRIASRPCPGRRIKAAPAGNRLTGRYSSRMVVARLV